MLAAVAVPAFMDYMKKSKPSEASLELNIIGKHAKRYYGQYGKYPVGDGALTSAQTCCGQPNNKCAAPGDALKNDPVWSALEFDIDGPTQYRYRYHSTDGKTAVVEALGDLDCDGTDAVWRLDLSLTPAGNPRVNLTPPASGCTDDDACGLALATRTIRRMPWEILRFGPHSTAIGPLPRRATTWSSTTSM